MRVLPHIPRVRERLPGGVAAIADEAPASVAAVALPAGRTATADAGGVESALDAVELAAGEALGGRREQGRAHATSRLIRSIVVRHCAAVLAAFAL